MGGLKVEVTIKSVKLKNVNRGDDRSKPYYNPSVWVDLENKSSTRVDDDDGDEFPRKFVTLSNGPINKSTLHIDVFDGKATETVKPLIGSAWLSLSKVVAAVGFGNIWTGELELKGPSGRVEGTVEVEVVVSERAPKKVKKRKIQTIDYGKSDIHVSTNKDAKLVNLGGIMTIISGIPTDN